MATRAPKVHHMAPPHKFGARGTCPWPNQQFPSRYRRRKPQCRQPPRKELCRRRRSTVGEAGGKNKPAGKEDRARAPPDRHNNQKRDNPTPTQPAICTPIGGASELGEMSGSATRLQRDTHPVSPIGLADFVKKSKETPRMRGRAELQRLTS